MSKFINNQLSDNLINLRELILINYSHDYFREIYRKKFIQYFLIHFIL